MKSVYEIDPVHSNVHFTVRHLMISNVRGGFSGVRGTLEYDPDNVEATQIQAEVDVTTIDTRDASRDTHLKSADFFETDKHPTMTFVSTKTEKLDDGELKMLGNLTLRGVTKPVTLTVSDISPEAKDPWGNTRIGASIKGKLNRRDFGLHFNAPLEGGGLLVGEEVKLDFELEFVKQVAAAV